MFKSLFRSLRLNQRESATPVPVLVLPVCLHNFEYLHSSGRGNYDNVGIETPHNLHMLSKFEVHPRQLDKRTVCCKFQNCISVTFVIGCAADCEARILITLQKPERGGFRARTDGIGCVNRLPSTVPPPGTHTHIRNILAMRTKRDR